MGFGGLSSHECAHPWGGTHAGCGEGGVGDIRMLSWRGLICSSEGDAKAWVRPCVPRVSKWPQTDTCEIDK